MRVPKQLAGLYWLILTLNSFQLILSHTELIHPPPITPSEYLDLKSHICNGTELPEDLKSRLEDSRQLEKVKQIWFKDQGWLADHCLREESAWRWNYVHELQQFAVYIQDQSIDQRLAHGIYTTSTAKIFDIDIFKYNSGDEQEDERNLKLVAGPQVNDEQCGRDLEQMLAQINQLEAINEQHRLSATNGASYQGYPPLDEKYLRLARALDSFGRYESGHLLGKMMTPGAYGQCLLSELKLEKKLLKTRYCWAKLKLDLHLDETLKRREKSPFEMQQTSLFTGICIPETCHSKSFKQTKPLLQRLVSGQFKLPKSMYINETLELDSLFCLVDDESEFSMPVGGKLLLIGLIIWTLFAIYVTKTSRKAGKSGATVTLTRALDLNESLKQFLHEEDKNQVQKRDEQERPVQLDTLNMLKCLLSGVVVLGHSLLVWDGYSMDQLHYLHHAELDYLVNGMFAATLVVDTFFVITGILLAFFTLKSLAKYHLDNRHGPDQSFRWLAFIQQWFMFTLIRYLRIVPLFALVYWFKRWVLIYSGWGPFWDFGFSRTTKHGACLREQWWVPFTFWSAYLPLSRQCLLQSWSISNDLFFSIFSPPILLLLYKRPKTATLIAMVACSLSLLAGFVAIQGLPEEILWEMKDFSVYGMLKLYNFASLLYSAPHLRVTSLIVGVLAGYHLYYYDLKVRGTNNNSGHSSHKWPHWFTGPATSWATSISSLILISCIITPLGKLYLAPYHRLICVHLLTTLRVTWVMCNAVLFVQLMTTWKETRIARMSSNKFWKIASRLNYAILLLHLDILLFNQQISSTTQVFSKWSFISAAASAYLFCIPIGLYLHIFIENPLEKLIKFALFRDTNKSSKNVKHKLK